MKDFAGALAQLAVGGGDARGEPVSDEDREKLLAKLQQIVAGCAGCQLHGPKPMAPGAKLRDLALWFVLACLRRGGRPRHRGGRNDAGRPAIDSP